MSVTILPPWVIEGVEQEPVVEERPQLEIPEESPSWREQPPEEKPERGVVVIQIL